MSNATTFTAPACEKLLMVRTTIGTTRLKAFHMESAPLHPAQYA
jgi:hypothetical protein